MQDAQTTYQPPKLTPRIWLLKGRACSSAEHVMVLLCATKCGNRSVSSSSSSSVVADGCGGSFSRRLNLGFFGLHR